MQHPDSPQNKLQGIMVKPQSILWTLLSLINSHTAGEPRHLLNGNALMNMEHFRIQGWNFHISVLLRELLQALQVWLSLQRGRNKNHPWGNKYKTPKE